MCYSAPPPQRMALFLSSALVTSSQPLILSLMKIRALYNRSFMWDAVCVDCALHKQAADMGAHCCAVAITRLRCQRKICAAPNNA